MGMLDEDLKDKLKIHAQINHLETEFDFVMIEELFYESLVLLSEDLCLPLDYMIGYDINSLKVE